MNLGEHFRITGDALKNWIIAQIQDSIAVGLLWLIGLYVLRVPWAPLWALLAATLQVVPHLGPVLGLIGPVLAAALRFGDWEHPLYVLMLYAVIAVVDGFLLQPYIMKRVARVPMWASILTPIVLGIVIPFWGVLLAPRCWRCCMPTKPGTRSRSCRWRVAFRPGGPFKPLSGFEWVRIQRDGICILPCARAHRQF